MMQVQRNNTNINCFILLFITLIGYADLLQAAESVCAEVKIEIKQELTLERQAFDAHMRINNGLDNVSLDNVQVDVKFSDSNGNPVLASSDANDSSASFFIRIDSMEGISDVSGNGEVLAKTSADIHWLIIPAPGSAGQIAAGKLYLVGATLRYSLAGEENIVEVTPDTIYVKPLPELTLDYFLTHDVYADDPFTQEIEASEPFTLGVRVKNNGSGTAKNLKIDSAQPTIVENQLGLLIGFEIIGSYLNDEAVKNTLLIDFGDIPSTESRSGRWVMETTLSGQFTDISAEFSHADELGGQLTSLIEQVNTHLLIRDVIVDLPGRDKVRDFLALDTDTIRVYESNSIDTVVTDQTAQTSLVLEQQNGSQAFYALNTPQTAGLMYVKLPDPYAGSKEIKMVIRSDGKKIQPENAWLSKTRDADVWTYYVNFFDSNGKSYYRVEFDDPQAGPKSPVIQFIADKTVQEGHQISFIVEASDPDGTIPALSASSLPAGASFIDGGEGVAVFNWIPAYDQAGVYDISYHATDGQLTSSRTARITVNDNPQVIKTYDINLVEGFNIINYPVEVAVDHESCSALLNSLGDAGVLSSISRYNPLTGEMDSCDHNGNSDFAIKTADALMINMLQSQIMQVTGAQICPLWLVHPGPNYVGHPAPPSGLGCFELLNSANGTASSLQKFNSETGRFDSCIWDQGQAKGNNYPVLATDGLILNMNSHQFITLPGCE